MIQQQLKEGVAGVLRITIGRPAPPPSTNLAVFTPHLHPTALPLPLPLPPHPNTHNRRTQTSAHPFFGRSLSLTWYPSLTKPPITTLQHSHTAFLLNPIHHPPNPNLRTFVRGRQKDTTRLILPFFLSLPLSTTRSARPTAV